MTPMAFYHGTTSSHLDAILKDGLVPQCSHDNRARTCTYLTDDRSLAVMYAELASTRRGGSAVVCEIDEALLDLSCFEPDDYEIQNLIDDFHDPDRVGNIGTLSGLEVDERMSACQNWYEVSADLSLEISQQIAYVDVIPVGAIVNIKELWTDDDRALNPKM